MSKTTEKSIAVAKRKFLKEARAIAERISKARDELRNLVDRYDDMLQDVTDAEERLDEAIEVISQSF